MNPDDAPTAVAVAVVEEGFENVLYFDVRLIYVAGLIGSIFILLTHNVDNQTGIVLAVVSILYLFVHMSYLHRRPAEREAQRRLAEDPRRIAEDDRFVVVPKRVVAFTCFLLMVYLVFIKFHFFGNLSDFLAFVAKLIK
ncbi:unnamed protein product [Arabidopsis halleri]